MQAVGLDFGTTNSALGVADGERAVLARFPHKAGFTDTFRSILYFHPELRDAVGRLGVVGGGRAIDAYLEADGSGRLIQSLKTYLADRGFQATNIFGTTLSLGELLKRLLVDIRARAEEQFGDLGPRLVVGRPVKFAGGSTAESETLALDRLRNALAAAGWSDVVFEFEPIAAAYYYESLLDHDESVLIADFGGGTSDFSLIDVGPSFRTGGKARSIRGTEGVGIAGDALDARIMQHLVAPRLGAGSSYRSMFGKELTVPIWIYKHLNRWHHLSFLKSKKNIDMLEEILSQAAAPGPLAALLHVLEHDLGYHLYRAVERVKVELSSQEHARFAFSEPPLVIEADVSRAEFEGWIEGDVGEMAGCVDRLLEKTGARPADVDRVFMTGGSSFVPAVRRIFDERFGREKIRAGGEMISVATGLALRAQEESAKR
ncbi:MAG TPA: Hsp70 family protein [Polyangiaceae bacterium]|jgi:hypothetical chaperone protein